MFWNRTVKVDQSNADIGIGHVENLTAQQISGNRNSNRNGQSKQPTPPSKPTASYGIGVQLNADETAEMNELLDDIFGAD